MMKKIKYRGKPGLLSYLPIIAFTVVIVVVFIYLPDSVKTFFFRYTDDNYHPSEIPISTMRGVGFLLALSFSMLAISIALRNENNEGEGQEDVELALSEDGIYVLPLDIYPIDVPWNEITEIAMEKTWSGRKILVLSTPAFKLKEERRAMPVVKCDLSRLNVKSDDVYEKVLKYYRYHRGYGKLE